MNKELRLTPYQDTWASEFDKITSFLEGILLNLHESIIHVGSTSILGLSSKPILDIDIIFTNNLEQIIHVLTSNGYTYEGTKGLKDRHAFKRETLDYYEHHLYVVRKDSDQHKNHIDFKRNLQNNPKNRMTYQLLKEKLYKENKKDRVLYTNSKSTLVQKILLEERQMKTIIFAGGCFWGVEAYFKQLEGVTETEAGYINGDGKATYKEVCEGNGYAEAVRIAFDENIISLKKLLDHLFNIIDPTSINKQGPDIGVQYRTGIYNYLPEQVPFIKNYIAFKQKEYTKPIAVELETNLVFFAAEAVHQDYLGKNKNGYCHVSLDSYKNVE